MISVEFKTVSIKNFLSFGTTPVIINFKQGLNTITGTNHDKTDRRNGVGKSSVVDSVFFAVFGKTLRELEKKNLIANHNTTGICEVILDIDIKNDSSNSQVQIIRQLDPSKVILIVDGVDCTRDSIANTNQSICDLLRCDAEMFENCIAMTMNSTTPFMCKKKQDKRKFVESIFRQSVFSQLTSLVKLEYLESNKKFDAFFSKSEEVNKQLISLKVQEKTSEIEKQLKISNLDQQTVQVNQKRTVLQLKKEKLSLERIQAAIVDVKTKQTETSNILQSTNEKVTEVSQSIGIISAELRDLNARRGQLEKTNANCPTCNKPLKTNSPEDKQHIEEEVSKLSVSIQEKGGELSNLQKKKTEYQTSITSLQTKQQDLSQKFTVFQQSEAECKTIDQQISNLDTELKSIEIQITTVKSQNTSLEHLINENIQKQAEYSQQIVTLKEELTLLEQVKFVFSDEGVKSYLIKQALQILNQQLAYYLKELDGNCICVFDEYFEEQIINDKGKQCSYFNLSGAERKSVDLACLFAFMDIVRLQGNVSFNLCFFDELLDTSFDSKGIELVLNILKERSEAYKECIYLISHRKESAKIATGEVVYLIKSGGNTSRVEYTEQ